MIFRPRRCRFPRYRLLWRRIEKICVKRNATLCVECWISWRRIAEFHPQNEVIAREQMSMRDVCPPPTSFQASFLLYSNRRRKALSSLPAHVIHQNGRRRVIYVIPFTSIIEQNAAVFDEVFRPLISRARSDCLQDHSGMLRRKPSDPSGSEN